MTIPLEWVAPVLVGLVILLWGAYALGFGMGREQEKIDRGE